MPYSRKRQVLERLEQLAKNPNKRKASPHHNGASQQEEPEDTSSFLSFPPEGVLFEALASGTFLSEGSAADVWLCQHPLNSYISSENHNSSSAPEPSPKQVVKKVMRVAPEYFQNSSNYRDKDLLINLRKDFKESFRLWWSLNHPNIVGLHLVGPSKLTLFQEYCESGSLREYCKKELPFDQWISMLRDVLSGLEFLHSQDPPIVHGSINPGKVYVTQGGTAKLGEFGLSRLVAGFPHLVPSICVDGITRWMSPECFVKNGIQPGPLKVQLDIWSFGCTLFEVITKDIPYHQYKYDAQVVLRITSGFLPGKLEHPGYYLPNSNEQASQVSNHTTVNRTTGDTRNIIGISRPIILDDVTFVLQCMEKCWLPTGERPSSRDLLKDFDAYIASSQDHGSEHSDSVNKTIVSALTQVVSQGMNLTSAVRPARRLGQRTTPLFRGTGCHHCRVRKVKCDGGKPYCIRCISLGATDKCKYDETKKSRLTLIKEENARLNERIAHLERQLQSQEDDSAASLSALNTVSEATRPPLQTYSIILDDPDDYSEPGYEYDEATDTHTDATWPSTPWNSPPPSLYISSPVSSPTMNHPRESPDPNPKSPEKPYDSNSYPRGVLFGQDGRYYGGALPPYNAYKGAPPEVPAVTRRRPIPAPPVFGHDVVLSFFQRWKTETQPQTYTEDQYTQALCDGNWELIGDWWERDDLSVTNRNYLLELFLPYRKQVGLEIWVPDFLASLHLPPKRRPHPGFMWMIYSFAAFFSGDPELKALVPDFIERARRNLGESYAKGDRLFDYIRGQTLYASILYMLGNINEAAMATSSACHAAILCGLHKISSPVVALCTQYQEHSTHRIKPIGFRLEPAASPREHGERIAAFWQLILVDHSAAAATGLSAMFRDDGDEWSRVETVFPRPLEEYISGEANKVPYATLGDIFTSRVTPNHPDSVITLQVKATALLERAVRLATKWDHGKNISPTNLNKYHEEYNLVLHAIRHFKSYLPGLRPQEGNFAESQLALTCGGLIYERLFPHFITWHAEIQLYNMLEGGQLVAREDCLNSAREIKNLTVLLEDGEIEQLGVLLGHCWSSAHHILSREQTRCRERRDQMGVESLHHDLNVLHRALEILATNHHPAAVQAYWVGRS
ncbi:hypothetical protein OPQ81_008302 [Rhizoctonia solani]|nr:hypothetical protein OPQ81_008302 [Rhizoctonia solani]